MKITLKKPAKANAKHKGVVGLDIESSTIAATELSVNGGVRVSSFGVAPLGAGIFRDGEVREPHELGDAIKELFSARKLPRDVRLGIANQQVAVRTLRLPKIDNDNELDAAVRFAAQDHIPMPLDRAVLDWRRIPSPPTEEGGTAMIEVVAVAARREMLEPAIEAIRRSGLRLVGIDHSAFALIRALSRGDSVGVNGAPNGAGEQAGDDTLVDPALAGSADQQGVLFCNLGDITNLAFARGSSCLFSRVLNYGTEGIAQSLSEKSSLTLEHARQWLVHVGLEAPLEQIDGDPQIVASAREALASGAARLVDELRRSLEYYATLDGATQMTSVVVAGSGVAIPGLVDHLRNELPLPLEAAIPGPLAHAAGPAAGRLTLSYGLGLEG